MDADRKQYTFIQWYKPIYESRPESKWLVELFDFDNLIKTKNGYMVTLRKEVFVSLSEFVSAEKRKKIDDLIERNISLIKNGFLPFRLSGDADYPSYDDNGEKNAKMHMLPNFSLLPVTGGLNVVKNIRTLSDFVEIDLEKYFKCQNEQNLPYRTVGRKFKNVEKQKFRIKCEKEALKAFMDIFDSLDEYCIVMHCLDKKTICNSSADAYWNSRKKVAKDCKIDEEKMVLDIDGDEFR